MSKQPDTTLDFDQVVARAHVMGLHSNGDPRWVTARGELLPTADDCVAFVRWASEHTRWSHNVADVADRMCAKPLEAAVVILADIVAELVEE